MGINLPRKLFHIFNGLFLFILSLFLNYTYFKIFLIFLFLGFSIFEFLRLYSNKFFPSFLKWFLKKLLKDEEAKRFNDGWYFIAGLIFSSFILEKYYFQLILLILTFSDPIASFIGIFFGKHKIKDKTLEGSLGFFISTFIISYFWTKFLFFSLWLSLILSITEFFTKKDNFWISFIGSIYLKIFK